MKRLLRLGGWRREREEEKGFKQSKPEEWQQLNTALLLLGFFELLPFFFDRIQLNI